MLNTASVTRDATDPNNGMRSVISAAKPCRVSRFSKRHLFRHDPKRGTSEHFRATGIPDPATAADTGSAKRRQMIGKPGQSSATDAVSVALTNLGESSVEGNASAGAEPAKGAELRQTFASALLNGQGEARLVWLPLSARTHCAWRWQVEITSHARGEALSIAGGRGVGEVLASPSAHRILKQCEFLGCTSDSPSPFSPGCPSTCATQPAVTNRILVTLSAMDTNASPNGWIDDGVNETRGNNVDAHTDRDANDLADLPRPQGSARVLFSARPCAGTGTTHQRGGGGFVLLEQLDGNTIKLNALGFTEAAGNFR